MYNIHLITFANKEPFISGQKKLDETYKKGGITTHTMWNQYMIYKTNFYELNKNIFDKYKSIGFGLFIWKPYIILEKLNEIDFGEFIYYQDSSRYDFTGLEYNIQPVCEFMNLNSIELLPGFLINSSNKLLIKPECLKNMGYENNQNFLDRYHYQTSPLILKKTAKTLEFVNEWLRYCKIPECIIKTVPYHQCDQSILNILLDKYNFKGIIYTDNKSESKKYSVYWNKLLEHIEKANDI